MHAHGGDWPVVPAAPHETHGRRGQIVQLLHPDGSPPYRVRWLEDEHLSLVLPPPDAHLQSGRTGPVVLVGVDGFAGVHRRVDEGGRAGRCLGHDPHRRTHLARRGGRTGPGEAAYR